MNGFKLFQYHKAKEIHYKILYDQDDDLSLELVLSYPDDIWGDSKNEMIPNRHHKRIFLYRDTWAEIKNYSDFSKVTEDFNNAVIEFVNVDNWHDFKNEVNLYFIKEAEKIITFLS